MAKKKSPLRKIQLDTGVSSTFVEHTVTKDVTTLEALFDLIDNSIDAARDHMLQTSYQSDRDGLPVSYKGYKITLRVDENSVSIFDNCLGIDETTLRERVLFTNKMSEHDFGIGLYGIGLKRSLLKIGSEFALHTDNGESSFKARFKNSDLGGGKKKAPYAEVFPTQDKRKTLFVIKSLKPDILDDIHSPRWVDNAIQELRLRYGVYLIKGLEITLNHVVCKRREVVRGIAPVLRTVCKVEPVRIRRSFKNVDVIIEAGIHQDYVFPSEEGHKLSNNRKLSDYFGLYYACNDRVIVSASTDKKYGWSAKWHSEYNGFVCWIKFVSKKAELLPWNTAKTALRTDSSLFLEVRDIVQELTEKMRPEIKKKYGNENKDKPKATGTKGTETNKPSKDNNVPGTTASKPPKVKDKPIKKPTKAPRVKLPRERDMLIDWSRCLTIVPENRKKEWHMFVELQRLSSENVPISCTAMIRMFLETTVKEVSKPLELKWKTLAKNSLEVAVNLNLLGYLTDAEKELIRQYSNTENGLFTISNIQSQIHSTRFHPSQSKANTYWDELDPFFAGCWKYIQDKEINI